MHMVLACMIAIIAIPVFNRIYFLKVKLYS